MKEMKTLKFPNQEEAYEIVDAYAREQLSKTASGIPAFTAEDEGKVLRIVDGVPTWVSLPNAEEASF